VTAVPADTDALALLELGDIIPNRIDATDDLVAGYPGIFDVRHRALLDKRVTVTHPTGLDIDADLIPLWLRDLAFGDFEFSSSFRNDNSFHRHILLLKCD
jgi:hypothetical protein